MLAMSKISLPAYCTLLSLAMCGCSTLQDPASLVFAPGASTDYAMESNWASLPERMDASDQIPRGLPATNQIEPVRDVDVFFIYPTQYFRGNSYHAGPGNKKINRMTDDYPMRLQASAFNVGGRLYAPRYRQAHIGVFTWQDSLSSAALEIAYEDVRSAFLHYLHNWNDGRGIILAGHSQGSWHMRWLLQEFFDGKPLSDQLIVAYGPGFDWYPSDFKHLKPCATPLQTECACSWMSYGEGFFPKWLGYKSEPPICTHPITWELNGGLNRLEDHQGVVLSQMKFTHAQRIQAYAERGVLQIKQPDVPFGRFLHRDNWHIGDINLFWLDIRDNVEARSDAYLERTN